MTYQRNGFVFTHVRGSTWHVTFNNGQHFAYVSTKAVIRAITA